MNPPDTPDFRDTLLATWAAEVPGLDTADPSTFYTPGPQGFTDYP